MAVPAHQKIWTISPNNRITYVSLNDTVARYLKGVADFLLAHGYTCKGSCNGTTGAMDGVYRWSSVANVTTRGANTSAAASWVVLTDGNGCNICLSYVGSADDHARIAYSPSGVYAVAGTPTFTPTATDEQILWQSTSVIGATTSLDRIWNGWVDSEAKLCRFFTWRNGGAVGATWGVELVSSRVTIPWSPTVWGFAYLNGLQWILTSASGAMLADFSANDRGGRGVINGVAVTFGGGAEVFFGNPAQWTSKPELYKSIGFPMVPMSIGSNTASRQGPAADLYDWRSGQSTSTNGIAGSTFPNRTWVQLANGSGGNGGAWPWDGVSDMEIA